MTNALSMFGRMSYAGHMLMYPVVFGGLSFAYNTYSTNAAAKQKVIDDETAPKARAVDPDLFQPFSAIPFHNNIELKYRYADVKMHNYLDPKHQMNLDNYVWKNYHNSYDHGNKKTYYYNWVNMVPSHNK